VVRPDHYVFGTAATRDGFLRLVDDLEEQLASPHAALRDTAVTVPTHTPGNTW
jgi:hypothetical protein